MDISAIVFILILCLPVFFFWRWVFRKSVSKTRKRVLTWVVTIITAPIVYAIFVMLFFYAEEYYPNRDFDRNVWKTDTDTRYEYTHDLIKSNLLIGKTKPEVLEVLGKTDTSGIYWYYYIGYRPEILNIDPSYIEIHFENGKVTTVKEQYR